MDMSLSDEQLQIRDAVTELCADFPDEYWIELGRTEEYPYEFVKALSEAGWLSILIPEEYGGGGRPIADGAIVLEAIARSGGSGAAVHAQMYTMGTILRHGSDEQKQRYLPGIASGELRLQAFGVTEPDAGSDTTRIRTRAVRDGDHYVINGQKMWTSRFEQSDLMLLIARTTPYDEVEKKYDGVSTFIVDLRQARAAGDQISSRRIDTMVSHHTYEVFFDDLIVPAENRIGEEGRGFRYILSGMNAERVLTASGMIGNGMFFIDRASKYAAEREVFGRPIGQNQGVQFPIAQAYAQLEAASLMRWKAADDFARGDTKTPAPNMAKLLASQALWAAANAAMDTYGGVGLAVEYGIEGKFRDARLAQIAPINNNLILAGLAHNHLGMPKSY